MEDYEVYVHRFNIVEGVRVRDLGYLKQEDTQ